MQQILEAIQAGASGDELSSLPVPDHYRAAFVRREDTEMFEGLEAADKDPAKSLHVGDVATPELAPDEAYVAVMASSINFNTVWTSIFEPLPTFGFLERLGRESRWGARHDLPYHVVGSDAAGVVLRVGSAVRNWRPGDRVVVHCNYVDDQDPSAHADSMMAVNERIWGFESNYGGLAEIALAKAELKVTVRTSGTGAALLAVAGFIGLVIIILASITIAQFIIYAGLDPWWAYLIVTGATRMSRPHRY